MIRVIAALVVWGSCVTAAFAQPRAIYQQTQYKGQEIGKLTGDVYYARMDDYVSVFMVTPEGIVLVEPIGTEFATWLKGELASRFKVPVKFVIYSHHHWDHASGAAVYADTARIVGHEAMLNASGDAARGHAAAAERARAGHQRQRPDRSRRRRRATSRPSSTSTTPIATARSSGAEVTRGPLAFVRPPDLTYTDRMTIHSRRQTRRGDPDADAARRRQHHRALRRRHQRAVRVGLDHRAPAAVRRRCRDEGRTGAGEDGRGLGLRAISSAATACLARKPTSRRTSAIARSCAPPSPKAIAAGQTLEQAQASVTMDAYKDWEFYDQQRPANVAGTYRALTSNR